MGVTYGLGISGFLDIDLSFMHGMVFRGFITVGE